MAFIFIFYDAITQINLGKHKDSTRFIKCRMTLHPLVAPYKAFGPYSLSEILRWKCYPFLSASLLGPPLAPVPAGEVMSEFVICLCVCLRGGKISLSNSLPLLYNLTQTHHGSPKNQLMLEKHHPKPNIQHKQCGSQCMHMCEETHTFKHTHTQS